MRAGFTRRGTLAVLAVAGARLLPRSTTASAAEAPMFGLITQFHVRPGEQDAFVDILRAASHGMEGCVSYVVAPDAQGAVWVTEIWRDQTQHAASLQLPAVRDAIGRARPLITGVGTRVETRPVVVVG